MALRQPIVPQRRHPRMLIAQPLALALRLRLPPQHRALAPHRVQVPRLPVEPQDVRARQAPPPPVVRRAARLVAQRVAGGTRGDAVVPGAAEGAGPVDPVAQRDAVAGPRRQARRRRVRVREAEVREDEGPVAVLVVVFELEVVRFAVVLRDRERGGAEAEGAGEVVARVRGGGAGEAGEGAGFHFGGGGGVGGGEEGEG